jgi:hypothetical protein
MDLERLKKSIFEKQNSKIHGLPVKVEAWKEFLPVIAKGFSLLVCAGSGD